MKNILYDSDQIHLTYSYDEFLNAKFKGAVNAIGWLRNFHDADFKEIIEKLNIDDQIEEINLYQLHELELTSKGKIARDIIIDDYNRLSEEGHIPVLNVIKSYPKDEDFDFISTDVYSFHVDRSPLPTDTFLCTYYGASSDIIANNQVIQKIKKPEIRNQLIKLYDNNTDDFDEFLKENFFDLHYEVLPLAEPINLGRCNIWRLACDHPYQEVEPCVHRAPVENLNEPRLMLIC